MPSNKLLFGWDGRKIHRGRQQLHQQNSYQIKELIPGKRILDRGKRVVGLKDD